MEIEKIVSTVQEKLGKTDVSAQTIQKAVEFRNSVAPLPEGAEPDDAYFDGIVNLAKDFQGNINFLMANKANEWKKNFKLDAESIKGYTQEQLAELKKAIEGIGTKKEEKDEKYSELENKYNELLNRLDGNDAKAKKSELIEKIKESMRNHMANDEYVLRKTLENAEFDVNKSVEDLTKEFLDKYDAEYTACRGNGGQPRQMFSGGDGQKSWLDKKFEAKRQKEGWKK